MKKIFTTILMAFTVMASYAYDVEVDGIYYDLDSKARKASVTNGDYSGSVTIPSTITCDKVTYSVTSIGDYAFNKCTNLSSMTIPNSITSIGVGAFSYCSGLTSVKIPNSITGIGVWVFAHCSSLTSVTIPKSVTWIGLGAFAHCSALSSVKIPNSVTSIGANAFNDCSSLTSVTIPSSVKSIEESTFCGCSALSSVTIPNSVTSIGERAFYLCYALTSMTIPNSITSIGAFAFGFCEKLKTVTCSAKKIPSTNTIAFCDSPIFSATLYVPAASLEDYKSTAPWSQFGTILPIGNPTTISTISTDEKGNTYYDLSGRNITAPQQGKVNIVNGRKIYVR